MAHEMQFAIRDESNIASATDPSARKRTPYAGWKLGDDDRTQLLSQFVPTRHNVVADHITAAVGDSAYTMAIEPAIGTVVGWLDRDGMQVLVVTVNGSEFASDGRKLHITWSYDDGRVPADANRILQGGWSMLPIPLPIRLREVIRTGKNGSFHDIN